MKFVDYRASFLDIEYRNDVEGMSRINEFIKHFETTLKEKRGLDGGIIAKKVVLGLKDTLSYE